MKGGVFTPQGKEFPNGEGARLGSVQSSTLIHTIIEIRLAHPRMVWNRHGYSAPPLKYWRIHPRFSPKAAICRHQHAHGLWGLSVRYYFVCGAEAIENTQNRHAQANA